MNYGFPILYISGADSCGLARPQLYSVEQLAVEESRVISLSGLYSVLKCLFYIYISCTNTQKKYIIRVISFFPLPTSILHAYRKKLTSHQSNTP